MQWNPSVPGTLGPAGTVLIIEVSSFQGFEAAIYQCIVKYLVPVACVHNRGVSAIQGLEGIPLLPCSAKPLYSDFLGTKRIWLNEGSGQNGQVHL